MASSKHCEPMASQLCTKPSRAGCSFNWRIDLCLVLLKRPQRPWSKLDQRPAPISRRYRSTRSWLNSAAQPERGLSSTEAGQRLAKYGPNALVEKEVSIVSKILGHFSGPIAYMIEAAAVVSAIIGHWDDFAVITGVAVLQRRARILAGPQSIDALAALKKGSGAGSDRIARRRMADRGSRDTCARRHREDPARRHRSRRYPACQRRLCVDRSGGADGRIVAGGEEGRRCGLFRQHRQTGRDGQASSSRRARTPFSGAPPSSSPAPAR